MHFISEGLTKKGAKYEYETQDGKHTVLAYQSSRNRQFTIEVCGMIVHESKTFSPMVYMVEELVDRYKLRFVRYY